MDDHALIGLELISVMNKIPFKVEENGLGKKSLLILFSSLRKKIEKDSAKFVINLSTRYLSPHEICEFIASYNFV